MISERLVEASEVLLVLDGGCQHLFRQSDEDAWDECSICTGIIVRECTAVHCNVSDAIFEAVGRKCSPLRQSVAAAAMEYLVQLGLMDSRLHRRLD